MEPLSKFQSLLSEIFQFEASDLDFGIYRILNYKRDQIDKFIKEDIKNIVENAFSKHKDERLLNITQKFEDAKKKVSETLGEVAFTATGDLKAEFRDTHVGKDYLLLREQKDLAGKIDEIKLQVFNDLYTFFSRYYEEGDFVPQYRYSIKNFRYAIPYNGEEVKLYWANEGQYYTKTGILFRDYAFFSDAGKTYKIIFRTVSAREELSSNKATKARFFVLYDENNPPSPPFSKGGQGGFVDEKTVVIRFQYRELTDKEVKLYDVEGGSNIARQEKINQRISDEIIKQIKDPTLKAFLSAEYKNKKLLLLYQISRFTAKNTKDYFIHKNLRKFLAEQLDYFIKAEVLSIETLENEPFLDKHITRAKVVREVGEKIIAFLSQIEDFQKNLWEKKKFVLKTEYVITTDRVPEEFYDEILKNKTQLKEWEELGFEIATPPARNDKRKSKKDAVPGSKATSRPLRNLKLPVDTKHFSEEYKEKLLERLTENADLDDSLDGLLVKSENWQALNLLAGKYSGKVKCIYIDPPYNTGSDEFLYQDQYQHSSWLSMLWYRLASARVLMQIDGAIFVSIDDHEYSNLATLMNGIFGSHNPIARIVVKSNPRGRQSERFVATVHEHVLVCAKDPDNCFLQGASLTDKQINDFKYQDESGRRFRYLGLRQRGSASKREDRPEMFFPIYVDPSSGRISLQHEEKFSVKVLPKKSTGKEGRWMWGKNKVKKNIEAVEARLVSGRDEWDIFVRDYLVSEQGKERTSKFKTIWDDKDLNYQNGKEELKNLFVECPYDYPKPTSLLRRVITMSGLGDAICMDFFAGSGTTADAVMKLNKEDRGNRKYILADMANYFETIIIPRIKKIAYSYNWKDGKPQDKEGTGTFFKYQILEQYEDALDNLELKPNEAAQKLFKDDYLLKYFLEFETQDSPSFLNIEHLKDPFSYKLKVNFEEMGEPEEAVVDIPETFNYLLGLKVKKIKAREIATPSAHKDKRNKYLFILGEKGGVDIAVVWRKVDDNWDENCFRKDKEFMIKELKAWLPQRIYINGQSILSTDLEGHPVEIHYIEPEFKTLMFS
jgi:adenine-specific DNA-methyltransferase